MTRIASFPTPIFAPVTLIARVLPADADAAAIVGFVSMENAIPCYLPDPFAFTVTGSDIGDVMP